MLLIIFGPPAVGKMTVGRELAKITDFRLFHNHHTIEPLVEIFGYGTRPFNVLNSEFRRRVLEEAAASGVNLIFTYVWALELAEEVEILQSYVDIFGGQAAFVELRANLDTRLARNGTDERLLHKVSKRDVEWSDANVRELEQYVMQTGDPCAADELLAQRPHLRLDNAGLSAAEAARRIADWLPTATVGGRV